MKAVKMSKQSGCTRFLLNEKLQFIQASIKERNGTVDGRLAGAFHISFVDHKKNCRTQFEK